VESLLPHSSQYGTTSLFHLFKKFTDCFIYIHIIRTHNTHYNVCFYILYPTSQWSPGPSRRGRENAYNMNKIIRVNITGENLRWLCFFFVARRRRYNIFIIMYIDGHAYTHKAYSGKRDNKETRCDVTREPAAAFGTESGLGARL